MIEGNKYLKLDFDVKIIAKLKIEQCITSPLIENLDIGEYENSNVIIACGHNAIYDNIYNSVRILITDESAINKNIYTIPKFIDYVIVCGCIYPNNKNEIERLKNSLKLFSAIDSYNEFLGLEILEKSEINLSQVDMYGNTLLIKSIWRTTQNITRKLLERTDIDLNQADANGMTALMTACNCPIIVYVEILLSKPKVNINYVSSKGYTALLIACKLKYEYIALKLLERPDIETNHVNEDGETALSLAFKNKMQRVIKKLAR
jgi:hypothetical protein